ncbi:MAG: ABC transporter permease subunit [Aggregatilineales bacterium]
MSSNLSKKASTKKAIPDHSRSGIVIERRARVIGTTWRMIVILLGCFFALLPIVFVVSSSINPAGTLATQSLLPRGVENLSDMTTNFEELMFDPQSLELLPFWRWIVNSFIVAGVSTVLTLFITMLSAYSFSRFRFYGRRTLLLSLLLLQAFPNLLAMVAIFLILLEIGRLATAIPEAIPFLSFIDWSFMELLGLNALGGLIMVYVGGGLGLNTWLMKGFFDTIPRDIDESAKVDGASNWEIFWLLIFPLVRPIVAVIGVLTFIFTFNEFVLARIMLRDTINWTLMVGLYNFISAEFNRDWGLFAAGALVSGVPVVILYLSLQDQIVSGLTAGSVKG